MNLSPEGRLLLNLLRPALHGQPLAWGGLDRIRPDWERFLSLVRYHRLAPLLLRGLRENGSHELPPRVVADLHDQALYATARSLLILDALREVAREFQANAIPFLVLKGVVLSKDLYFEDMSRPTLDLDVLVHRSSYYRTKAVLGDIGYRVAEPQLECDKLAHFGEVEFVRMRGFPIQLDLHWDTLLASWEGHSVLASEDTWERARVLDMGTFSVATLAPEEHLVYLTTHLAFHHVFSGLLWLCDVFLLLKKYGDQLDWDRVHFEAQRSGGKRALQYTIVIAVDLLDAPLPHGVRQALRDVPRHWRLIPLERVLMGAGPPSQAIERSMKFLLVDGTWRRVRAISAWWGSQKPFIGGGRTSSRLQDASKSSAGHC
jgi:hypothetical protein